MEIEVGKVIDLEDGASYLISDNFLHEGQEYISLVAVKEPIHNRFAEVNEIDGNKYIAFVEDVELINLFKQYIVNDFFASIEYDD